MQEKLNMHKKLAKAEVNLNWLWTFDYGFFWLYIYIHGQFSLFGTSGLTGFMISLFLEAPAPREERTWNLMGASVRNGLVFFLLFWKKYYFIQKLGFLINSHFGNVFPTSGVIALITLLYVKLRCYKSISAPGNSIL